MTSSDVEGRPSGSPGAVTLWLAARPLRRPGCALRLAGLGAGDADDLLRTRSSSRRSPAGSPRTAVPRAVAASRAADVSLYAYLVAPAWWLDDSDGGLGGDQGDRRARDDGGGLPRLRARTARRLATVGALRGRRSPRSLPRRSPTRRTSSTSRSPIRSRRRRSGRSSPRWPADTGPARSCAGSDCVVAPLVRGELAVLLAVLGAGCSCCAWRTERVRRWRATWTAGDWVGAALLVAGAAVVFSAAAGHRSDAWYVATGFEKQRRARSRHLGARRDGDRPRRAPGHGDGGAFLVPAVRATDEGRAFVVVRACAAGFAFVTYTAVKGAFLSTTFATLIVERNVIYLVPIVVGGDSRGARSRDRDAACSRRRRSRSRSTLSSRPSSGSTSTPTSRRTASRSRRSPTGTLVGRPRTIERALVVVALVSLAILAAALAVRRARRGSCVAVVAALAWSRPGRSRPRSTPPAA